MREPAEDDRDRPARLGLTGLGTSAARVRPADAHTPSQTPTGPPARPAEPVAGRLAARVSEAVVETAAAVDLEGGRAARLAGGRPRLVLQRLSYPFPSRITRHAEAAEVHCMDWLVAHELLAGQAEVDRFRRSGFGVFAGRTHPDATAIGLNWIADWAGWACG